MVYGGGKYKAWLKNANDSSTLKTFYFEVPGQAKFTPDEMPEVPPDNGSNGTDPARPSDPIQGAERLVRTVLEQVRAEREEAGDYDASDALAKSIDLIATGAKQANALIAEASKGPSLDQMMGLVEKVVTMTRA